MFSPFCLNMHNWLHCIHWQVTGKEPMLEVAFRVQTSGHCSKEKGKENTSYYIQLHLCIISQAQELAILGFLLL